MASVGDLEVADAAVGLLERLSARARFPAASASVECAVSGGPDSMAMLVLAVHRGLAPTAVHVDHGLRPGSSSEFALVERLAARLGVPARSLTVRVEEGPNLEDRARRARHDALGPDVLLGHTLDDQAETLLWYLMRGTGPEGVAAMEPTGRPLLALRRRETAALCAALGIEVLDDPHNRSPRFTRSRIRHELLPLLDEIADRDVAPLLARLSTQQREVLDVLGHLADGLEPTDAVAVAAAHPAVASESLRRWWRRETGSFHAPDAAALARMLDVAAGRAVGADVVSGWRVERSAQRLRLVRNPTGDPRGADR